MDNFVLWMLFIIVDLSMVLIAYKFFGKNGLYAVIATSIIIANIQVLKTVEMLGFVVTLGNVLYGSLFLSTDLLSELHGKKAARKGVWIGFFALMISTLYMQIALMFTPHSSDFAQPLLAGIFSIFPRIALASIVAYLISQHHDVWAYHFWKKATRGKALWLRNNASTIISQLLDSVIFCSIAFIGVWTFDIWVEILITTFIFKLIVAMIDTPFIYYAKAFLRKKNEN